MKYVRNKVFTYEVVKQPTDYNTVVHNETFSIPFARKDIEEIPSNIIYI